MRIQSAGHWFEISHRASVTSITSEAFVDAEVLRRRLPPPYAAHEYFICGPDVMMDAIERTLGGLDVPMSRYHSERYSFV